MLILGDGSVGKTSMLLRYAEGRFNEEEHQATLGLDYKSRHYTPKCNPNETIDCKLWDTAGQERFRNLTQSFYKQANGVVIAFDVTSEKSF